MSEVLCKEGENDFSLPKGCGLLNKLGTTALNDNTPVDAVDLLYESITLHCPTNNFTLSDQKIKKRMNESET